jgi:hypothetical protein
MIGQEAFVTDYVRRSKTLWGYLIIQKQHTLKSPHKIRQENTKIIGRTVTTTNTRETYRCKCNSNMEAPFGYTLQSGA